MDTRAELERRREELADRVAELHWDLGGLAYEMAIRDHFRNDVLLKRAAQLQELDTELAEVERKLSDGRAPEHAPDGARRRWAQVLPPAQVCALLLVAFLGFGVALGASARRVRVRAQQAREVVIAQAPSAAVPRAAARANASPPAVKAQATPSSAAEGETESTSAASTPKAAFTPSAAKTGKASTGTGSSQRSAGSSGTTGSGSSGGGRGASGRGAGAATKLPPVKHVFVVMLDNEPYASVFGPASPAHYLASTLEHKGELLVRYYAVAHEQLANGIALLSGQGPTPQTAQNCPTYEAIAPGAVGADGQLGGSGCVYPGATQTLAGQLSGKHLTWKAYLEGMDEPSAAEGPARGTGACAHPTLGAQDPSSAPSPPTGQSYATWRNPFVYFSSITSSSACKSDVVGIGNLKGDLARGKRTPSFSYIVPGRCDDGNATPCSAGATTGMLAADSFLQKVVPEILASKAYRENGLLAITVDEAPSSGEYADSSSCCSQPRFPNVPASPSAIGIPGGGQVGALLLSPFIKGGNLEQGTYNHFSLLRTVEDLFGLPHLGYAAGSGVSSFAPSLFSQSP